MWKMENNSNSSSNTNTTNNNNNNNGFGGGGGASLSTTASLNFIDGNAVLPPKHLQGTYSVYISAAN